MCACRNKTSGNATSGQVLVSQETANNPQATAQTMQEVAKTANKGKRKK